MVQFYEFIYLGVISKSSEITPQDLVHNISKFIYLDGILKWNTKAEFYSSTRCLACLDTPSSGSYPGQLLSNLS